jgi:NAD-reducing hydrogenase small subunit
VSRPRFATVWLDGCSGCHMSFLDMDERLLDLAEHADLVYSPLVDIKEYPDGVDVCLVEGAVSSTDDVAKIKVVRARTKTLVSFGDCAVTANVPSLRNPIGARPLLERAYLENVDVNPGIPHKAVPTLLESSVGVHKAVPVDVFLPGCPPSADVIHETLLRLLGIDTPPERPLRFG